MDNNEIEDGIICQNKFGKHPKSKLKILWILKESNDPDGGGWSLIDFLATRTDQPGGLFHYKRWASTFGLVIEASYGLLNGFIKYDEIEKDLKRAAEILDYVAVINIKKVPGGSRSSLAEIANGINPQVILNQINEINPDIVIGGNTLWILAKNNLFLDESELSNESWGLFKGGKIWVDAYHPNNTKVTHEEYYFQILNLVKKYTLTIMTKTPFKDSFRDSSIPFDFSQLRTALNAESIENIFVRNIRFQNKEFEVIMLDRVFESSEEYLHFLMDEKILALSTQEFELAAQIQDLIISESKYNQPHEFFYLKYFAQKIDNISCIILFETNLLSFKYNLIKEFTTRN